MNSLSRLFSFFAIVCVIASAGFAQVPRSNHVYIVAEENISYEHMVGNTTDMPYLNSLISNNGLATQFYSDQHSSLPNYFWVTAGQFITNNNETTLTYDVDNIVRHVLANGETFRSYAQSLPYAGFTGLYSGAYLKRHAPLIYFTDVANSSTLVLDHVDTSQMALDIASGNLPNFAFITPDATHDLHDCPNGIDACMQTADQWLQQNIGPLLARPEFQPGGDGLLIMWADEADLDTDNRCSATVSQGCGGRILVALIGPQIKSGYQSTITYHHENVLRTMLEALGTTSNFPGAAQTASDMADFFRTSSGPAPPLRQVTIQSPLSGAVATSPVPIVASASSDASITAITAYVDNVSVATATSAQLNTAVTLSQGAHRVVVNAWDSHGSLMQSAADITVTTPTYGVNIDTPNDGGTTGSSMHVSASATSSAPVTAIRVYVDNVAALTASGNHMDAYIPMTPGNHHVVIDAWDASGNVYSKGVSVATVPAATSGVVISAPAANALTGNSVRVQASAQSSLPIVAMRAYVDGQAVYTCAGSMDTSISLSNGSHQIGVNAWDSSGAVFVNSITVNASSSASNQVSIAIPATANAGTAANILVNASSSAAVITATALYVDNQLAWMGNSSQLNVSGVLPTGTHSVVAQTWDATGAVYKTATGITVK